MDNGKLKLPDGLISTLKNARNVLVLTGAGMSAESGVPTFRDAQTGLWAKHRPEDLATPEAFRRNPQLVWDWYTQRRENIRKVAPHAGHAALVEMERYFETFLLVTQNVDSLHQQAGSTDVVELHGNIMLSVCSETGEPIDEEWITANPGRPPASPHHPQGLARPGVVWFGEQLPMACHAASHVGSTKLRCLFFHWHIDPGATRRFLAIRGPGSRCGGD